MGVNSKQKGKRGELELSHTLQKYGYSTRRGQQFAGTDENGNSFPDVVGIDGLHIECKRTKTDNKHYSWMNQSKHDAEEKEVPVVMHRADRQEWLVTMTLDDFIQLWKGKK